ncbi:MAG: hypothetical protein Alis3KO_18290 [Aliiglaciecola sp.]
MNKQHDPSSHDPLISELYGEMSQEQPDVALDDKILAYAKRNITDKRKNPEQVGQSPWRKYQWPFSVAASALFVTMVVYTQFDQFNPTTYQPQSIPADPFQIVEQSTFDKQQAQSREKLETKSITLGRPTAAQKSALPEQEEVLAELTVEEPELSNFAEQEAQSLAARALDDIEIEPLAVETDTTVELDTSLPLQGIDADVAEQYAARQAQSLDLEAATKRRVASESFEIEMISTTASRIDNSSFLNTEYLDKLLVKFQSTQSDLDSATTETRQRLMATQKEIQQDILSYLLLLSAAQPDIKIENKYLEILTAEQRVQLVQDD